MNKVLFSLVFATIASIGGMVAISISENTQTYSETRGIVSLQLAEAIRPPMCTMSYDEAKLESGFNPKEPQNLPQDYALVDAYSHSGIITMLYSDKPLCGNDAVSQTYRDGLLKFIVSTSEQSKYEISNGMNYFEEFKKHSDYPERIFFLEINGNPAMGWESGMKKSITLYDNGTIVDVEEIPYPAQLKIIDQTDQKYYSLKGYFPLETLQQIARSIG